MEHTIEELAKLLKVDKYTLEEFYEDYSQLKSSLEGNEDVVKQAIQTLTPIMELFYSADCHYQYLQDTAKDYTHFWKTVGNDWDEVGYLKSWMPSGYQC